VRQPFTSRNHVVSSIVGSIGVLVVGAQDTTFRNLISIDE
jgi:hypothetical protein